MTSQLVDRKHGYEGVQTAPDQGAQHPSAVESLPLFDCSTVCATVKRRRSLTDSLNLALQAFWTLAKDAGNDHQAATKLAVEASPSSTSPPGLDADAGSYEAAIDSAEHLLGLLAQTHSVHWELPVRLLARLMVATVYGLVIDYGHNGDSEDARRILLIFSYQISQFGRRIHKNGPH